MPMKNPIDAVRPPVNAISHPWATFLAHDLIGDNLARS